MSYELDEFKRNLKERVDAILNFQTYAKFVQMKQRLNPSLQKYDAYVDAFNTDLKLLEKYSNDCLTFALHDETVASEQAQIDVMQQYVGLMHTVAEIQQKSPMSPESLKQWNEVRKGLEIEIKNQCNLPNPNYGPVLEKIAQQEAIYKPQNLAAPSTEAQELASQAKQNFDNQLILLKTKSDKFKLNSSEANNTGDKDKGAEYQRAYVAAVKLHDNVKEAGDSYFKNPTEASHERFKKNCDGFIKEARPELEHHRGLKQILGNVALAVVGLGVLYLIAASINKATTGNFLFLKTDSANIVDSLQESIHKAGPSR